VAAGSGGSPVVVPLSDSLVAGLGIGTLSDLAA
jgi:hypothetical protein